MHRPALGVVCDPNPAQRRFDPPERRPYPAKSRAPPNTSRAPHGVRAAYGLSLRPVENRYCDHATTATVIATVTANDSATLTSLEPRKP